MSYKPFKPVILIDDDNVANCWDHPKSMPRQRFEKITGQPWISLKDLKEWNLTNVYGEKYIIKLTHLLLCPPKNFYRNIEPMDGVLEIIPKLIKKYTVRFVTTPIYDPAGLLPRNEAYWKLWWRILQEKSDRLHNWFGQDCPQIIGESDKTLIAGDILYDDNPNAALNKSRVALWTQLLFDNNYKLNEHTTHQFKSNWDTAESMIEQVLQFRENEKVYSKSPDHWFGGGYLLHTTAQNSS